MKVNFKKLFNQQENVTPSPFLSEMDEITESFNKNVIRFTDVLNLEEDKVPSFPKLSFIENLDGLLIFEITNKLSPRVIKDDVKVKGIQVYVDSEFCEGVGEECFLEGNKTEEITTLIVNRHTKLLANVMALNYIKYPELFRDEKQNVEFLIFCSEETPYSAEFLKFLQKLFRRELKEISKELMNSSFTRDDAIKYLSMKVKSKTSEMIEASLELLTEHMSK